MSHSAGLFRGAFFYGIVATILFLAGCGGGGGGGSSPVGPTPSLPDTPLVPLTTAQLSAAGKSVDSSFAQGALALGLPTATHNEKYAVLLMNDGAATTVKVNGGGSPGLADIRASEAPVQPAQRPLCGTPVLRNRPPSTSQMAIQANIAPSVRTSTSNEQLGQTVTFNVISGSVFNNSYTQRNGKLLRIGKHCKLFVDPEPYGVFSANAITDGVLDTIVNKFDNTIYKLLADNYGVPYDKDGDGRVAIYFSPIVTTSFAGYFDTENFTDSSVSNQRDMVYMWTPDSGYPRDKWLSATCETITHELQHLVNYSNRLAQKGYDPGLAVPEDSWLDEALSMGAEIRYRQKINDPATEERFCSYKEFVSSTSLTSCFLVSKPLSETLAEYGCVGLFGHYLFEQGNAEGIRRLVTSGLHGTENVQAAFANHPNAALHGFSKIEANWKKAVFAELNRSRLAELAWSAIPAHQKYTADFDIDVTTATHAFGSGFQGSIGAGAISMFVIGPPPGYAADSSALYMQAVDASGQQTGASINCTVLRLND